jgi:homoserine dehydrogenase
MTAAAQPLTVAIAGLGTVGAGAMRLLTQNAGVIERRAGRPIRVVAVSARDRSRDRGVDLGPIAWFGDAVAMAHEAPAEVFVELIGGAEGIARAGVEAAIGRGRSVVTANKALLAHHGTALARQAEAKGVALAYEAAVAGGIPVIKSIKEGLAGNRIQSVYGILNGTCNFILSTMRKSRRPFADVLAEAQKLGYAEADPTFDIDGLDTAHKLAILAGLAFGAEVNLAGVHVEGIRAMSPVDIDYADELGFRIKLLGIARRTEHGLEQRVHPAMVPVRASIAHVDGVFNAVVTEGDFVGRTLMEGRGAGAGPTASAVVADLIDLARGERRPAFAVPASELKPMPSAPMDRHRGPYYVRLMVVDRPGVIADIAAALRDEEVSMEAMIQRARDPGEAVPVVLTTHETEEARMRRALARIARLDSVVEPPHMIRIEAL